MSNLYGLIGEKLSHSYSPEIHSIIYNELNIEGYYHLFEIEREKLKTILDGLKALKAKGVNVTIPYKSILMDELDYISSEAKNIGAINTICFNGNHTTGYNTDYYGFGMMLEEYNIDLKNRRVVVLGTGGASKAVIQYLVDNKIANIILVSRNVKNAKEFFHEYEIISYNDVNRLKNQDIVINCTPVGMYPNIDKSPLNREEISKFKIAIDLIYNPHETLFIRYAKELGLKNMNGLYMLVAQAVKSQELWNDMEIDMAIVKKIYNILIKKYV